MNISYERVYIPRIEGETFRMTSGIFYRGMRLRENQLLYVLALDACC
jgi:hypothetical protein